MTRTASKVLIASGSSGESATITGFITLCKALAVSHSFLTYLDLEAFFDPKSINTLAEARFLAISSDQSDSIFRLSRHTSYPAEPRWRSTSIAKLTSFDE